MAVLLLEALLALVLLILIVWWTMFSGRPKGERRGDVEEPAGYDEPGGGSNPKDKDRQP